MPMLKLNPTSGVDLDNAGDFLKVTQSLTLTLTLTFHPNPNPNPNPDPNPIPDFLKMGANSIGLVAPLFPAGNLLTSNLNPNPHLHPNPNPNRP